MGSKVGVRSRRPASGGTPNKFDDLFAALTPGERAHAVRLLAEDRRVAQMARVGRYRVVLAEPLAIKPPHALAGRRLVHLIVFDYASNQSVDATVDLGAGGVVALRITSSQPMLSSEEQHLATEIAIASEEVQRALAIGDEPLGVFHYWSQNPADLAFSRRSAAVVFGRADNQPTWVAVVDLVDEQLCELVAGEQW